MGAFSRIGNQLYTGQRSIDFVGRKWLWYAASGVILVAAVLGLTVRGLNLGIEFKGGNSYTVQVATSSQSVVDKIRNDLNGSGIAAAATPTVTTAYNPVSNKASILVETRTIPSGSADDLKVQSILAADAGVDANQISSSTVGKSWGTQVLHKMEWGLGVFLVLVALFIWAYFREWKMSAAALLALAHDVVITVGVYALSGFEVTPATVTGFLTILGFSLYDTVVVFDKVRENTKNLRASRQSYAGAANLALNQTLVRSINTSLVALLPVAAILVTSTLLLGASSLKDISLALFVGMAAGTYSSIFIATPFLVHIKSGEKLVKEAARRANARAKKDDKYAAVPVFTEDMAIEEPLDADMIGDEGDPIPTQGHTPGYRPTGDLSGRTTPESKSPVRDSGAAGRPQPNRTSRSKRK
ncbi:protein-export membrane protein SecF [Nocardioides baekrokdamisoli]|uniref:Protein-export membrane protein SecF n=1 Tax=Nocardioides baekrokdamisoli TaxID=1804624 RepID=A0A3G9J029_9ACTN|nr:protein translocase subunit SecF [Nocardioides baekrokdamisoli]BBH16329.1 protein-export membrane protein SecF [Nocardioides baekrokdamisoli]